MNSLQTELRLITSKFPNQNLRIKELYLYDADFKSLCADLYLCKQMIRDYESEIFEKQHVLEEYRDIVKDLEAELENIIATNAGTK